MENKQQNHPEDYCHKCNRPNICWHIDSPTWNKTVRICGEKEILCPVCFAELYEADHPNTIWRLSVDSETTLTHDQEILIGLIEQKIKPLKEMRESLLRGEWFTKKPEVDDE